MTDEESMRMRIEILQTFLANNPTASLGVGAFYRVKGDGRELAKMLRSMANEGTLTEFGHEQPFYQLAPPSLETLERLIKDRLYGHQLDELDYVEANKKPLPRSS